jgi:hypothetical protein
VKRLYSLRNRLREKIGLIESFVNFLFVENDLMLALSNGNDGGTGQCFVLWEVDFSRVNASKGERGLDGCG